MEHGLTWVEIKPSRRAEMQLLIKMAFHPTTMLMAGNREFIYLPASSELMIQSHRSIR